MKKKTQLVIYIVLAISILTAGFYFFHARNLKNELRASKEELKSVSARAEFFQEISAIDSLLLRGDYTGALSKYRNQLSDSLVIDSSHLEIRISLAQRLLNSRTNSYSADTVNYDDLLARLDSVKNSRPATDQEIRQFDSLSFALTKANMQMDILRRQLKQKSYGEYLTFTSSKGNTVHYVGEVKDGQAHGMGVGLLDTGSRYRGEWKNNKRDGQGIFYWPDGEYYEGGYKDDKRAGQGTYFWPNGEKFVGMWENDERNGQGTFFDAQGEVIASGIWKNDELE